MPLSRLVYYGAIGMGILIAVSIVITVVSTILSGILTILSAAVSLAVLVGIVYVAYRLGTWLFGGSEAGTGPLDGYGRKGSESTPENTDDSQQRLRQQYIDGQIGEAEFERRIERELETESISRELERER